MIDWYLDVVDWMNVFHAVEDDFPNFLQTFMTSHSCHSITLYQNVALSKELDGLGNCESV